MPTWQGPGSATVSGPVAIGLTTSGVLWAGEAARERICWQVRVNTEGQDPDWTWSQIGEDGDWPFALFADAGRETVAVAFGREAVSGIGAGGYDYGFAAYRLTDGTRVWQTTLPTETVLKESIRTVPAVVGAVGGVLVGQAGGLLIGLDAASGRRLWDLAGFAAVSLDAGLVIGDLQVGKETFPAAVDPRTGVVRWKLDDHAGSVYGSRSGTVIVRSERSENWLEGHQTRWVGAVDGRVRGQVDGTYNVSGCLPGGAVLICHGLGLDEIVGFDPAVVGHAAWVLRQDVVSSEAIRPQAVYGDRLYSSSRTGGEVRDLRTGKQTAAYLPVTPNQITTGFGVVNEGSPGASDTFTIYRATAGPAPSTSASPSASTGP